MKRSDLFGRAAVMLVPALLAAGCTAKPEPAPPAETTVKPGGHGTLAQCLHSNGVPDSAGPAAVLGPPAGVDPGVWERAMQVCSTLAPGPAPS